MKYVMEQELVDVLSMPSAEAIEFKQPNCWMGMYIEPSDTEYWSERVIVISGTLKEFNRINLEEDVYVGRCIQEQVV